MNYDEYGWRKFLTEARKPAKQPKMHTESRLLRELDEDEFSVVTGATGRTSLGSPVKLDPSMLKKRPEAEFVFSDGDHSIQGAGIETLQLLRNKTPNIMAHDINLEQCQMAYSGKGSELMGRVFASHRDYYYIEDKKKRDGERTERGFMFATTSKENYNIGTRIFKQIC